MRLQTPLSKARAAWQHRAAPPPAAPVPSRAADSQRLFDEELLARLRRLVLVSRRANVTGLTGEHRSRRRGSAPEFSDFKRYSPGEDFRRIDWNTYARLGGLFIRLSEVTTELTVHVLVDASNSMDWRGSSAKLSKFDYGRRLAGALGYVALWHFDRLTIVPFGSDLAAPFGPVHGRAHLLPMFQFLEGLPTLGRTDLAAVLERYFRLRRQPGILLLASDLLSGEPADIAAALRFGRERGWQTNVLQVIDAAELEPAPLFGSDVPQSTELIEVETGERLRLSPTEPVLAGYRSAVTSWLTEIEMACTGERAEFVRLQTDWPLDEVVLRVLHQNRVVA